MTAVVGGLLASLLQGYELVAKIDVRIFLVFCPELEFKETPIKGQYLDVSIPLPDDMVQTYSSRFRRFCHRTLLEGTPRVMLGTGTQPLGVMRPRLRRRKGG
jgi:hypothetical protein